MSNDHSENPAAPTLPGRNCDGCTLCCKVLGITELNKPEGAWCPHCEIGKSCRIYGSHPAECRTFQCGYLVWPMMESHWFPPQSKMVVSAEGNRKIIVHVDRDRPDSWKRQPYYSEIKDWARRGMDEGKQVLVMVGRRGFLVLPTKDIDLGIVEADDRLILTEEATASGPEWHVEKIKADDPRIG